MIFLLLSIVFSTLTVSFFKLFERKGVHTFHAIVVNYLTCGIIGSFFVKNPFYTSAFWTSPWLIYTLILGFLFISIFYLIALTAQKISVSASMVAAKLSVVIPVLIAYFFLGESLGFLKIAGILVSFMAVYFISYKDASASLPTQFIWYLPVLVFVGSGCIDAMLKMLETRYIPAYSADDIVTATFFFAFIFGFLVLLFQGFKDGTKPHLKSLQWGVFLGIPNYFSMYFLVETLALFPATFIFPVNNMAIVASATLVALIFFHEKLNPKNWLGFILALAAIILISLA
jgi:drug/metabolite transporter (DMT)-like permease